MDSSTPSSNQVQRITIAHGDGIGPEIMAATLRILDQAKARLEFDTIEIGQKVYESGSSAGIEPSAWETIRRNRVFLKAPITTPRGGGFKSLNVTARKTLGLFANVRPVSSFTPFVPGAPNLDVIIVRENEEDTYAGIEHRQTDEVYQCLKLISRPGCERIVRYAFELARFRGRSKVTCLTKDNIMKMTDGLFLQVFREVSSDYPDIHTEEMIVDIGSARLAAKPQDFDVVVCPNLYGDIVSDIVAEVAGSVGMCGSSNVGKSCSMFEAIHGSAPDIAGQGIANPSGLLQGAILMLDKLGQGDIAQTISDAWLRTIEDGIHTGDIFDESRSKERVGTEGFTNAVIQRLGERPQSLPRALFGQSKRFEMPAEKTQLSHPPQQKKLVGVDLFLHDTSNDRDPNKLAERLQPIQSERLALQVITNRGVKVWPDGFPETYCTDHWRCRFMQKDDTAVSAQDVLAVQAAAIEQQLDVVKTENLYEFDGERGFSVAQGT
ncbi:MAG: NADP-dependent isocitrate dehydrogenase [Planctomycetota bacterium]